MLKLDKINFKIEDRKILDDFSLDVEDGKIHVIMGPNGVGKSTLSNIIMGNDNYKDYTGTITFNGEKIDGLSVDERSRKGIFLAMQNPIAIEGITNSEFLRNALTSRDSKNFSLFNFIKDVEKSVDDLKMDRSMIHKNINQGASGGERKKNEVLQIKILKPSFIILDELDSGLDVDSLKIVCQNIVEYKEQNPNTSILMITHYPRILKYIHPDYVHMMKDGKIVKTGDYSLALQIEKYGYSDTNDINEEENYE